MSVLLFLFGSWKSRRPNSKLVQGLFLFFKSDHSMKNNHVDAIVTILIFSSVYWVVPVDQTVELHNQIHLLKIQHHEQLEQLNRERKCLLTWHNFDNLSFSYFGGFVIVNDKLQKEVTVSVSEKENQFQQQVIIMNSLNGRGNFELFFFGLLNKIVGSKRGCMDGRMDCPSCRWAGPVGTSTGGRKSWPSGGGRGGRIVIGPGAQNLAAEDRCPSRENQRSAGRKRTTREKYPAGSGNPSSGIFKKKKRPLNCSAILGWSFYLLSLTPFYQLKLPHLPVFSIINWWSV